MELRATQQRKPRYSESCVHMRLGTDARTRPSAPGKYRNVLRLQGAYQSGNMDAKASEQRKGDRERERERETEREREKDRQSEREQASDAERERQRGRVRGRKIGFEMFRVEG